MRLKLDMHIHTRYSSDGLLSARKIIEVVRKKKLDGVAITDHNAIKGGLELQSAGECQVIVGEEIKTSEGEIIGYFLSENVASNMSAEETIEAIRGQGGLVCIPHPLDRYRRSRLTYKVLEKILDKVDMLETFNSRNLCLEDNDEATRMARERNLAASAGSDAHLAWEVGNAFIEIEPFSSGEDFLKKLREGECWGRRTPPLLHAFTVWLNLWKGKYF